MNGGGDKLVKGIITYYGNTHALRYIRVEHKTCSSEVSSCFPFHGDAKIVQNSTKQYNDIKEAMLTTALNKK